MTEKRMNSREALEAGVPVMNTPEGMVAELTKLETRTLEALFLEAAIRMETFDDVPTPLQLRHAAIAECVSAVMVMRADAGEVDPDHFILRARRDVHARVAQKEAAAGGAVH